VLQESSTSAGASTRGSIAGLTVGNFTSKVIPEVHAAARTAGILQKDVDLASAIDARFVDAATK